MQYRLSLPARYVVSDLKITPALIPLFAQNIQLGHSVDRRSFRTAATIRSTPSGAIYNTLDGAFASNLFGSKTSFTRVLGRNATYHRLTRDVILARSLSLGVDQPHQRGRSAAARTVFRRRRDIPSRLSTRIRPDRATCSPAFLWRQGAADRATPSFAFR